MTGCTDSQAGPAWLTEDYLERALRKYTKDNSLRVLRMEANGATSKGENYASVMTRLKVDYVCGRSREVCVGRYIMKANHENDPTVANIMNGYEVFKTEMLMYEKILPQLAELLREIGDHKKLFAETIHVDYERSAIIFEDLTVWDFGMADRLAGMDMTHTKMALAQLAKMHATASVLNERKGGILTKLDHGIFNRHTEAFAPLFENMFDVCAEFAAGCQELGPYYREKLLKLKPHVMEYATRVYDPQPTHFHTLNHGDFWVNNVMLNYNTDPTTQAKTLKDMIIVDFQFCSWASPAVDLHYFFNTSLEPDMRLHKQDELIQYYYTVLTESLRALRYAGRIPSLREFVIQIEVGRFMSVPSALVCQGLMINDKTDDADMQALLADDERARRFRKTVYNNKAQQENVKRLLPIFDRKGLLDVEQ